MSTHDLYRVGLFGDFRLIRTYVLIVHIKQDCLVTKSLIRTYVRVLVIRKDSLVTLD